MKGVQHRYAFSPQGVATAERHVGMQSMPGMQDCWAPHSIWHGSPTVQSPTGILLVKQLPTYQVQSTECWSQRRSSSRARPDSSVVKHGVKLMLGLLPWSAALVSVCDDSLAMLDVTQSHVLHASYAWVLCNNLQQEAYCCYRRRVVMDQQMLTMSVR